MAEFSALFSHTWLAPRNRPGRDEMGGGAKYTDGNSSGRSRGAAPIPGTESTSRVLRPSLSDGMVVPKECCASG